MNSRRLIEFAYVEADRKIPLYPHQADPPIPTDYTDFLSDTLHQLVVEVRETQVLSVMQRQNFRKPVEPIERRDKLMKRIGQEICVICGNRWICFFTTVFLAGKIASGEFDLVLSQTDSMNRMPADIYSKWGNIEPAYCKSDSYGAPL